MEGYHYKVAIAGSPRVGKATLAVRMSTSCFSLEPAVVGQSLVAHLLLDRTEHSVEVIVTSGLESHPRKLNALLQIADGFILAFDLTSAQSFQELQSHYFRIDAVKKSKRPSPTALVLVGLKADLAAQRVISKEDGQRAAEEFKARYLEASAKTGEGTQEVLRAVVDELVGLGGIRAVDKPCCSVV